MLPSSGNFYRLSELLYDGFPRESLSFSFFLSCVSRLVLYLRNSSFPLTDARYRTIGSCNTIFLVRCEIFSLQREVVDSPLVTAPEQPYLECSIVHTCDKTDKVNICSLFEYPSKIVVDVLCYADHPKRSFFHSLEPICTNLV